MSESPKLYALMITKDDDLLIGDWLMRHSHLFDAIAVVDGSSSSVTENHARQYPNIVYTKDPPGLITDQTLRHAGYQLLAPYIRHGDWVFTAHPDEFLIHNPRSFMGITSHVMYWFPLVVLPHPSERDRYLQDDYRPVADQRHYWWREGRLPHLEWRMWRVHKEPVWDLKLEKKSSFVMPVNYYNEPASALSPLYWHYKLPSLKLDLYSKDGKNLKSQLDTDLCGNQIESFDSMLFDESHIFGDGYNVFAKMTSDTEVLLRFGNPPRILKDPSGQFVIVNDAGQKVY